MINNFDSFSPNTPVIVGVGFSQVKSDNPLDCPEPYQMMLNAIRDAAADAGDSELPTQIESIAVQQGSWKYKNPGKLLAEALGCGEAKSILADLGVLQLMPLFELCQAINEGQQHVGVVVGGESRYRDLRSQITQQPVADTLQSEDTPAPDVYYQIPDAFCSELETQRGIWAPGEFYAIAESALRYSQGISIETHRDKLAALYSAFSRIAARNPHAWLQQALSAEEIRNPSAKNAMIAFPFTKRMISQWNVNQAVAIIVCSLGRARELGLNQQHWIFPLSGALTRHVVPLVQKRQLHTHPGAVLTGERALALAGVSIDEIAAADVYSCFPSAIQSAKQDLKLPDSCPLSVTGTMAYAGGPYNHGALDAVARMVEVLRAESDVTQRRIGLVSNISGMFGKHGVGLFSNCPNPQGYACDDVTPAIAAIEIPIPVDGNYTGPATVVGYSVMYNKAEISHAIAYCDTPQSTRTVVRTSNKDLAERMTREEFCGRTIQVQADGDFYL